MVSQIRKMERRRIAAKTMVEIIFLLVLTCFGGSSPIKENMKTDLLRYSQQWQNNCNATIDACGSSKLATWPLNCYHDKSMVPAEIRLCSSVCENGRTPNDRDKCETFCPEYLQRCLPFQGLSNITTKAAVKPSPKTPSIIEFPNVLGCSVPGSVCRRLAHLTDTEYYSIACYRDTADVLSPDMESCWELCNSKLTEKCKDFCYDYLRLCPDLKFYDKTTTRLDENEWPFKKQCTGITSSQCRNDRFVGAPHYSTNCVRDTSQLDRIMRSCEEVCGDSSNMDRCYYYCSSYLTECGITTPAAEFPRLKERPDSRVSLPGERVPMQAHVPSTMPSKHAQSDITQSLIEPSVSWTTLRTTSTTPAKYNVHENGRAPGSQFTKPAQSIADDSTTLIGRGVLIFAILAFLLLDAFNLVESIKKYKPRGKTRPNSMVSI